MIRPRRHCRRAACRDRRGRLVRADQGVFQITPPLSNEVDGYGKNDTSSIHKVIKAVITAEFSVR